MSDHPEIEHLKTHHYGEIFITFDKPKRIKDIKSVLPDGIILPKVLGNISIYYYGFFKLYKNILRKLSQIIPVFAKCCPFSNFIINKLNQM